MSRPFVRTVHEFDTLPSTNDTARELVVRGGVDLPLLVLAHRQTAGRGRGNHAWWSGEGSLTFTVAIDAKSHALRADHEPRVALAVASLIARLVEPVVASRVEIRWPNDVECRGRKLAGILPERVETNEGPRLVIGVGLNMQNRFNDAPAEIRVLATSVALEISQPSRVVPDLLGPILAELPGTLSRVARDDPSLAAEWRDRDSLAGRVVRLLIDGRVITGIGAGIEPDGALRLQTGVVEATFYGGQVLRTTGSLTAIPVDERTDKRTQPRIIQNDKYE